MPVNPLNAGGYSSCALGIDPQNPANLFLTGMPAPLGGVGKGRATGDGVGLFRSADGGQSWSQTALPEGVVAKELIVDPASPNTLFVVTGTTMYRSTDAGSTFTSLNVGLGVSTLTPDPRQAGVIYATALDATTRNANVYKSTDHGATFTSLGLSTLSQRSSGMANGSVAVDPSNSNNLFLGRPGGFFHSSDGGKTWETLNVTGDFYNIEFDPKNGAIYAAGYLPANGRISPQQGHVVKSVDGGKTWTALDSGLNSNPVTVHLDPNTAGTFYAVPDPAAGALTGPGGIYASTDSGATWGFSTVAPQVSAPNDALLTVKVASGSPAAPAPGPTGTVSKIVSAASQQDSPVAPESIAIATGSGLATGNATADNDQPPMILSGTTVNVTDSASVARPALLFSVSATQVVYQIPPGTAIGTATVTITAGDGLVATAQVQIAAVAPGIYTLNPGGLAKAYALRRSSGNVFIEDVFDIDPTGAVIARPITVSNGDEVHLIAYGTGFRAAGGDISATVGGIGATVLYAGRRESSLGSTNSTS